MLPAQVKLHAHSYSHIFGLHAHLQSQLVVIVVILHVQGIAVGCVDYDGGPSRLCVFIDAGHSGAFGQGWSCSGT